MIVTILNGSTSNITCRFKALASNYCCCSSWSTLSGSTLLARRIKRNQKTRQGQLRNRTTAHDALLMSLKIFNDKQHYNSSPPSVEFPESLFTSRSPALVQISVNMLSAVGVLLSTLHFHLYSLQLLYCNGGAPPQHRSA